MRVATLTLTSNGCATMRPHTTTEAPAKELLVLYGGALWGVGGVNAG
jgi:hypothetical protein